MKSEKSHITIVGAGISGLCVAFALAKFKIPSTLLEKTQDFLEVGAGLQLSPNVTRILNEWGLLEDLLPFCVKLKQLDLCDGLRKKNLLSLPLSDFSDDPNAPYLSIHRADFQKVLVKAIRKEPLIHLMQNANLENISQKDRKICLKISHNGEQFYQSCDYFLCADGVWSKGRKILQQEEAVFSNYIAFRLTLHKNEVPSFFPKNSNIQAWCGPKHHVVIYPLREGELFNIVAITYAPQKIFSKNSWSLEGNLKNFQSSFSNWHQDIQNFLKISQNWTHWPLFVMPSISLSYNDSIYYLGDAAHAILPFSAQGAAMAIEDAYILSFLFSNECSGEKIREKYQNYRYSRLRKVQKRTFFNQNVYHATSLKAQIRNRIFQFAPTNFFIKNLKWLYDYRVKDNL